MAYDKVVDSAALETDLTRIADAIREKSGTEKTMAFPDEFVEQIKEISGLSTLVTDYPQMNEPVTSYLAAADAAYTDTNGDSISVIANYETSKNDADRPLCYPIETTSGTLYLQSETTGKGWKIAVHDDYIRGSIANAVPGEVHQYLVKDTNGNLLENGRIKPTGKIRMVKFSGYIRNFRDLGGWACDGGTIKYGKLFRSAVISSSETWIDPQISENIGIRHEIDFRGDKEANYMTESTLGTSVRYQRFPMDSYYADMIKLNGIDSQNLKKALNEILEAAIHNEGTVFHCSLGRDRTGTVAFLLLALLGVTKADIDKDYELSGFSAANTPAYRTSTNYRGVATYLAGMGGKNLRDNAVWWFIKSGFHLDQLNAFRKAMINGTPDELTAESFVTTYSVSNQLTACSTSNNATSVEGNAGYSAILTADDGYRLDSVTVTMGGVNVTNDVYANGKIIIEAVTGDVVISAVAIVVKTYTNQIPISTDESGNIFNGIGYQSDYRLNGSGAVVSQTGTYITGFIPCVPGDIARFSNINIASGNFVYTGIRIGFYDADKKVIEAPYWATAVNSSSGTFDDSGNLKSLVIPTYSTGTVAFARFSSYHLSKNSIITINEEIL